jgi:tetratricopeptide (TPR) repeat protein
MEEEKSLPENYCQKIDLPVMKKFKSFFAAMAITILCAMAYGRDGDFKLALVDHPGQLTWSAGGFRIIEVSAKPSGREMGIRGQDPSHRLTFLGFLFLFPEQAPLTSSKCRDGVMGPEKAGNTTLKILESTELTPANNLPVSVVSYMSQGKDGKPVYVVRGFVASGDICGDLEFYSETPIHAGDADLKKILASYQLQQNYVPQFSDIFFYAQILYQKHMYEAAAPIFEKSLARVSDEPGGSAKTMTRVATDQAGMAYGISGNITKARAIFEKAIAADPDYPLYYYNLACADAEEKNLVGARKHLQEAFDRKSNVIAGETMPDPTQDDSFLPYRNNKEFWTFVQGLGK